MYMPRWVTYCSSGPKASRRTRECSPSAPTMTSNRREVARSKVTSTPEPSSCISVTEVHRQRLRRSHRGASIASHVLVPTTGFGITARNSAFRMWSAAAVEVSRMLHRQSG